MRSLVQQPCLLPRHTQTITGRGRVALFSVLLCLCALAGAAAAQEPPKGLSKDQVIKLLKEDPPARVQYLVNR